MQGRFGIRQQIIAKQIIAKHVIAKHMDQLLQAPAVSSASNLTGLRNL